MIYCCRITFLLLCLSFLCEEVIGASSSLNGLDQLQCGRVNVPRTSKQKATIKRPRAQHIVGGSKASWPWQVAIVFKADYHALRCGGSIISRTTILTAAHCIKNEKISKLLVRVGARNLHLDLKGNDITVNIKSGRMKPTYNETTMVDDIAILTLAKPLTFNEDVQPICLSQLRGADIADGREVIVSGYGKEHYRSRTASNFLLHVKVPKVGFSECSAVYKKTDEPPIDKDSMLCAGVVGRDSCQGDSGGPAVILREDGRYEQVGVVSYGFNCGVTYGVYASVGHSAQWISQQASHKTQILSTKIFLRDCYLC